MKALRAELVELRGQLASLQSAVGISAPALPQAPLATASARARKVTRVKLPRGRR